ncbi:TetR/AcrR family transcriptional regulator, partial [Streptomyces anulatus]
TRGGRAAWSAPGHTREGAPGTPPDAEVPTAAARLSALLRQEHGAGLSTAEAALMKEWLDRVANARPDG